MSAIYTLITGASSGIGRSIAIELSSSKNLIIHGRNLAKLEETKKMCLNSNRHLIWLHDLENIEEIASSLQIFLKESHIFVEVFIHCAGIAVAIPMKSSNLTISMKMMNINFFSATEIISTLLKKKINFCNLINIIFISSIWSNYGSIAHAVYSASKSALDGLMRSLAVELAPLIRVNSILPGAINTPMAEQCLADPEINAKFKQDYPLGLGKAEDIANAVVFLMSEKSRWLTGQQIIVDGGRTINMSLK
ncbi:MAG: SDR family oxidoreductase [Pseudomonadota bacterium]